MTVLQGPVYQSLLPADGATDILQSSPVYLEIRGDEGVDQSSIKLRINSVDAVIAGVMQPGFSGAIFPVKIGFNVYVRPDVPFADGSVNNITITSADLFSRLSQLDYSFTVVTGDIEFPVTIALPQGATFASSQQVTLLSSEPAVIRYTVDGSMPTASSPIYASPLSISTSTVLKYFSTDAANNVENVNVQLYTINLDVPDTSVLLTVPSLAAGSYTNQQSISLTSSKPATIYYQINGTQSLTLSNFTGSGTSPLTDIIIDQIPGSNEPTRIDLAFFAVDHLGNQEAVKHVIYFIGDLENNVAPTNVMVNNPYIRETFDISWDDLSPNWPGVLGYNVYRYSNLSGKYQRLNRELISTTFYRDRTTDHTIIKEDVSRQFKRMTAVRDTIDFVGNIVDVDLWEAIDKDRLFYQNDAAIFDDVFGNSRDATLQSKFRLHGNFDIETELSLVTWPTTDPIYYSEAAFVVAFNDYTYIKISRQRLEFVDYYVASLFVNSTQVDRTQVQTIDSNCSLRITRAGQDVSLLFYDGVSWITLKTYSNFSDHDLKVKLYVKSSDKPVRADFKDLKLNLADVMRPFIKDIDGAYRFATQHRPITSRLRPGQRSTSIDDVSVEIDGKRAYIRDVNAVEGIVTLETGRVYDDIRGAWFVPPVPTHDSVITVTYQYTRNRVNQKLVNTPYHYKVTSVLDDGSETRLNLCEAATFNAGKLDYMYKEAMRRNSWLLDAAGERVLLFVKKTVGDKARSYEKNERTHMQPKGTDLESVNTQFVGGYEGPYEIRISPVQTETKINMTDRGLRLENSQDTWTSMTPVITQRDFILRRNGSIWAIGPVMTPEVRGIPVQQHFSIGHVDRTDIRYKFVDSLNLFNGGTKIGLRPPFDQLGLDPLITEGDPVDFDKIRNVIADKDRFRTDKGPDFNDPKGRSLTFENQLF